MAQDTEELINNGTIEEVRAVARSLMVEAKKFWKFHNEVRRMAEECSKD